MSKMLFAVFSLLAATAAAAGELANPPPCTSCFVGTLQLSPNPKDAKTQILGDDLYFVDSNKLVWKANKGDITDGASIPDLFTPIVGGKFEADFLPAAVMHDHYCDDPHKVRTWRATARMFYEAMLVNHTDVIKAKAMYYAVYSFGPHWAKLKKGVACGDNCINDVSAMSFEPADYVLSHERELEQVQSKIAAKEIPGNPLSLDDLDALAEKNHPENIFIATDDRK